MPHRWRMQRAWFLPLALSLPVAAHAQRPDSVPRAPREARYAQVGDVRMYYRLYGRGRPLLLLHGGGGTIDESFRRQISYFARDHLLVAPEQQGHGHTRDADGPLDYGAMAETTAQLLGQLHIRNADVLGWSDGGIVGLLLAARHPDLVRRLVITGASTRPLAGAVDPAVVAEVESWKPEADSAGRARYARLFADSVSHYPVFVAKLKELWLNQPTDAQLGPAELAKIEAPTLVIGGDHDVIRLEHTVELFHAVKRAELLIVPGSGHNTLGEHSEWINPIIRAFFARPP